MSGVLHSYDDFVRSKLKLSTTSGGIEEWRPWRDGTYDVSNLGRIRRVAPTRTTRANHVLRPSKDKTTGYWIVGLRNALGVRKTRLVHIVVAEVWIGPRPEGLVVNHKFGNKDDNAADKLEYITHAANVIDGIERALRNDPSRFKCNLTAADVVEIRRRAASGERVRDLAAAFDVHRTTISAVVLRQTWRHVA